MKSDLVDLEIEIRHETDDAVLVIDYQKGKEVAIWIPKSVCEVNDDGTITVKEWFAIEKGLV